MGGLAEAAGEGESLRAGLCVNDHAEGACADAGDRRTVRKRGNALAERGHEPGHGIVADGVANDLEAVEAEQDHPAVAVPSRQTFQRQAVRKAALHVVQRHVREPRLTIPEVADHGVEAGGETAELVIGSDGDLHVFALLQLLHGPVEVGDGAGQAAGQDPRAGDHAREPQGGDHDKGNEDGLMDRRRALDALLHASSGNPTDRHQDRNRGHAERQAEQGGVKDRHARPQVAEARPATEGSGGRHQTTFAPAELSARRDDAILHFLGCRDETKVKAACGSRSSEIRR